MKIARIPVLTYTPGELEYFCFIRGGVGADCHQGPDFYQFPDGSLMMTWSAYDYNERSNDCVVLYSISKDRGLSWSEPQVYFADRGGGSGGIGSCCRLLLRGSNQVLMFRAKTIWHEIEIDEKRNIVTGGGNCFKSKTRFFLQRSSDGGRTFDYGEELPYLKITGGKELPEIGCYGTVHGAIQLKNGRIVAVFYYLDPERSDTKEQKWGSQHYKAACLLSDDKGCSWKRGGEIEVDTPRGVMEPEFVEIPPNRIFCLFRTKGGYLYQTVSENGGESWSPSEPSALPSPESMARMIRLRNGNLMVVWNNVSSTTQQPRHPLSAVISKDNGKSWDNPRIIADESGENQLSNHNLIQLDDGRILLGISHYRATRPFTSDLDIAIFDEKWLS
ncbi:MAG: sialidase family protein [Victivallaceae bacterium]|nr:sialidase family protein [Victivallaceae bacterium]